MEGVGQLFGSHFESDDGLLNVFLNNLDEHRSFWTDPKSDAESIFSKLNGLLVSAKTRDRGLKILVHLLPDCPLELVEEKAQLYLNVCTKVCEQRGPTQTIPLVYNLLQQLLLRSLGSNELHKLLVNRLPKLLEAVVHNLEPTAIPSALSLLEVAMQHYAGACGPSKSSIESLLYSLVDSTDRVVINRTANCLLLLQQIRGGGQHGTLHKKTWDEYYLKLIDTIHDLLNKIFTHTPETFDEEDNLECLKLPAFVPSSNPVRNAHMLANRACNLISFLDQAIVGAYPVPKPIAPFKALNLVLRGLSVSCEAMGKNPIAENIAFGAFLPSIHYGLLEVLDGLVLALGTNLLMFGDSICEMFPKCLKATQAKGNDTEGAKKSFIRLRTKIYDSIQLWCEKMRYGSNIEMVNEALLEQIMLDITPYESEIALKMGATGNKRLSGRAKRKLQNEKNAATALNQNHSGGAAMVENKELMIDRGNEPLCRAALSCLAVMLQSAGCFIKPVTHKLLQEKIVPLCFTVVTNCQQLTGLYGDDQVRVALLRAYAALIVNPHHHCPPPLQYAGYIFNTLQTTDCSAAVRSVAAELARTFELVVHPWKDTLYFPMDKSAIKDALVNKDKHPLAMFAARQVYVTNSTTGSEHESVILETSSVIEPEIDTSLKNTPNSTTSPNKENVELAYESEGEINESLAVTEASDESMLENDEQEEVVEEQAVVSVASVYAMDDTLKEKANGVITIPDESDGYDAGTIDADNVEQDDASEESGVVAILDSDEEQTKVQNEPEEDDVVEVPMDDVVVETNSSNAKNNLKHSMEVMDHDKNNGSAKKAKLDQDSSNVANGKAKNIDDIVEEMVAEFVDEP